MSCDFEPAAHATGVRDALLLTGNPWNRPVAKFTAPSATISWFGSTRKPRRAAYVRESTLVSANATSATARPPSTTGTTSSVPINGSFGIGNPLGIGPSTATPAVAPRSKIPTTIVAPPIAISAAGICGYRFSAMINAKHAVPIATLATLAPPANMRSSVVHVA